MEIIARRKERLFGGVTWMVALALCIALVLAFVNQFVWQKGSPLAVIDTVFTVIAAGLALIFFVYHYMRYKKTPKQLVVFDGVNLITPDGTYPLTELLNVVYRRALGRYRYLCHWGRLTLYFRGAVFTYDYVADVEATHNRLLMLRLSAKQ